MSLDDYILSHIDPEGEYLHALWRDTQLKLSYGQMASGHLQGRLLKMLVEMIRPYRVIELGTFSGYSALSMAEGLPEGAELHTIEVYDENEDFLRRWIGGSPWADRIHLHIGDALDIIPTLGDRWDLAFVDADKREYVKYYEMLLPRMNPGGFILADNQTFRRADFRSSTTLWPTIRVLRTLFSPCATDSPLSVSAKPLTFPCFSL